MGYDDSRPAEIKAMNSKPLLLSLLLVFGTVTCASAADVFAKVGSDIVHRPSGVVFPGAIGSFRRGSPNVYDRTGRDISMRYALGRSILADAYSYPVTNKTGDLNAEFRNQQIAINQLNRKVRLLVQENTQTNQNGRVIHGKHATSNLERDLMGRAKVQAESQLFVFRDGPWYVACRFSYPRSQAASLRLEVHNFVAHWVWKPRGRLT